MYRTLENEISVFFFSFPYLLFHLHIPTWDLINNLTIQQSYWFCHFSTYLQNRKSTHIYIPLKKYSRNRRTSRNVEPSDHHFCEEGLQPSSSHPLLISVGTPSLKNLLSSSLLENFEEFVDIKLEINESLFSWSAWYHCFIPSQPLYRCIGASTGIKH